MDTFTTNSIAEEGNDVQMRNFATAILTDLDDAGTGVVGTAPTDMQVFFGYGDKVQKHDNFESYFGSGPKHLDRKARGKAIAMAFARLPVKKVTGCCATQRNTLLEALPRYACRGWACPLCWAGKHDLCGADQVMRRIGSVHYDEKCPMDICISVAENLAMQILDALDAEIIAKENAESAKARAKRAETI